MKTDIRKNVRIERLFRTYYRPMFRLAMALLHDEAEAKDATSDIFAKLLDGRAVLPDNLLTQPEAKTKAWLLANTRNHCLDIISHKQVKERVKRLLPLDTAPDLSPPYLTETYFEAVNLFAETQFTPQTRTIFSLRFHDDYSCKAIAQHLTISEAAVYKHLAKALKKLKEHFNTLQNE
ncbi:RNA polymerase sigma factor [Prevotella sp.]|uniref:RNA polymerase sigma factor n=1 Tax=Prevotella sp. TaxID=59823 RepID=UPI002F925839